MAPGFLQRVFVHVVGVAGQLAGTPGNQAPKDPVLGGWVRPNGRQDEVGNAPPCERLRKHLEWVVFGPLKERWDDLEQLESLSPVDNITVTSWRTCLDVLDGGVKHTSPHKHLSDVVQEQNKLNQRVHFV